MTNKITKLREEIDYRNRDYWKSEDAAGLMYFLNKSVVFNEKVCYNKRINGKTSDKVQS